MAQTSIEWTEQTWNPVTGCTKISQGCKHCYAATMHARLTAMKVPEYSQPFTTIVTHPHKLALPKTWKKASKIFVNSMSDLFHADVPDDFIQQVFEVMNDPACAHHTFQVLTKRADRMAELAPSLEWGPNIWMGVSVENNAVLPRIDHLRTVPAAVRWLSVEPLLEDMAPALNLSGIDWVVVGGESGPGARQMQPDWVQGIRDLCQAESVPFFFKQWGGVRKKKAGRELDGRTWDEEPEPKNRKTE